MVLDREAWFAFARRVERASWAARHKRYVFLEDEEGHLARRGSFYELQLVAAREGGQDVQAVAARLWTMIVADAAECVVTRDEPAPARSSLFDFEVTHEGS